MEKQLIQLRGTKNVPCFKDNVFSKTFFIEFEGKLRQCKIVELVTHFAEDFNIEYHIKMNIAEIGIVPIASHGSTIITSYIYNSVEDYNQGNRLYNKDLVEWIGLDQVINGIVGRKIVTITDLSQYRTYMWQGTRAECKFLTIPNTIIQDKSGTRFAFEHDFSNCFATAQECKNNNKTEIAFLEEDEDAEDELVELLENIFNQCNDLNTILEELHLLIKTNMYCGGNEPTPQQETLLHNLRCLLLNFQNEMYNLNIVLPIE